MNLGMALRGEDIVREIFRALREIGMQENTLMIFISYNEIAFPKRKQQIVDVDII